MNPVFIDENTVLDLDYIKKEVKKSEELKARKFEDRRTSLIRDISVDLINNKKITLNRSVLQEAARYEKEYITTEEAELLLDAVVKYYVSIGCTSRSVMEEGHRYLSDVVNVTISLPDEE